MNGDQPVPWHFSRVLHLADPQESVQDHPRGWKSLPSVELDGQNWPVPFAAGFLGVDEEDLRALIKIAGLQPSGVIKMADFRRSGRQPKAYPATGLIRLSEVARSLREEFSAEPADNQSQAV